MFVFLSRFISFAPNICLIFCISALVSTACVIIGRTVALYIFDFVPFLIWILYYILRTKELHDLFEYHFEEYDEYKIYMKLPRRNDNTKILNKHRICIITCPGTAYYIQFIVTPYHYLVLGRGNAVLMLRSTFNIASLCLKSNYSNSRAWVGTRLNSECIIRYNTLLT